MHTTQGNLQIQYNPYQNINGIFHETRANSKICMETQKTPQIAKIILRKKNRAEVTTQATLQSFSHPKSCLVAKSCPTLATPWTVAWQAPLSITFPRQDYYSRLPLPSPGDLLDPRIKTVSPAFAGFFTTEPPEKTKVIQTVSTGEKHYRSMNQQNVESRYEPN